MLASERTVKVMVAEIRAEFSVAVGGGWSSEL